jgi:pimeloyl-ACP methyl ester carboxylesterase
MAEFVETEGGRIAYDVTGEGPLVVLSHGMGDRRAAYRFLVPLLVEAGFRVANVDLRGHGESSTGWSSVSRTDTARDLLAVVRHLGGGPATIVGHSFSGGAATIAAATEPELVSAIVELDTFTRAQSLNMGAYLRSRRYRNGITLLVLGGMTGNLNLWARYLNGVAFPGVRPNDHAEQIAALQAMLREPGRKDAFRKAGQSKPTDAGAQLANIKCPALVVFGTEDPDFADPRNEAEAIVAEMPSGLGTVAMVEGAGHYPHTQYPERTAELIIGFLRQHTGS